MDGSHLQLVWIPSGLDPTRLTMASDQDAPPRGPHQQLVDVAARVMALAPLGDARVVTVGVGVPELLPEAHRESRRLLDCIALVARGGGIPSGAGGCQVGVGGSRLGLRDLWLGRRDPGLWLEDLRLWWGIPTARIPTARIPDASPGS